MADFGERGRRLWEVLAVSDEFSPAGVLAVEACRMADRLEWLDADPELVQEARLTAAALRGLLESPALKRSDAKAVDGVDALAARRAARRAGVSEAKGS